MYAVTDGMPGLTGSPWSPGSGHNLLVHSMCRLPGAGGTWMVVRGGMGTVTSRLASLAAAAGARDPDRLRGRPDRDLRRRCRRCVHPGRIDGPGAGGAGLARTRSGCPACWATRPRPTCVPGSTAYAERSPGQTMKVNLALAGLPRFAALPDPGQGQHGTTVHLLPPPAADGSVLTALREAFADAAAGRLPAAPPLEWYLHSTLDPSLLDENGTHSSALFVQGVPHEVAGSSWAAEQDAYVDRLLELVEAYAPGTRDLLVDVHALAPPGIEEHFGITGGNIMHVDNAISFTDRMPYAVGVDGVYAGAAGCHPAGSVIGAAGHNAARRILADLA